jgi:signal transduction histidine kinase
VTGALEAVVAFGDAPPTGDSPTPSSGPWSVARSSAESVRNTLLPLHAFESDELSRERFDPLRLLRAVEQELAPLAARQRLALTARSEGSLPELWADFQRLKAALVHIGERALRSAPEGGEVQVLARPLLEDEGLNALLVAPRVSGVELRIIDHGRNPSLTEREATLESCLAAAGVDGSGRDGLGLALARYHVELHGGRLTIEEHRPAGVAVVVTLPLEPGAGSL